MVKNLPANAGDSGLIPGSGRSPGKGNSNPLQYSCLEKSHGQKSLAGYTPRGCRRGGHNLATKQQQWAERGLEIGEAERRRWKNLGNKYLILSLLPVSKLLSQLESCRAQAYISSGSFSWALRSTRKGWEWPWRNKQSIIIRSIYDVLNVVLDTLTKIISFKNGTEIP